MLGANLLSAVKPFDDTRAVINPNLCCRSSWYGDTQFASTNTKRLRIPLQTFGVILTSDSMRTIWMNTTVSDAVLLRTCTCILIPPTLSMYTAGDAKNEVPVTNLAKIKFPGKKEKGARRGEF